MQEIRPDDTAGGAILKCNEGRMKHATPSQVRCVIKEPAMTEKCSNCRYWQRIESNKNVNGECRCYHPERVKRSSFETICYEFPITSSDTWCGEWMPEIDNDK